MEQHGGFPGYYPVMTLVTFYPWSALLPAALVAGFVDARMRHSASCSAGRSAR